MRYPSAVDPAKVGTYSAVAKAGGGYVWDAVLEYRVWCYPAEGAEEQGDGSDYYYAFATFDEAREFAEQTRGAHEPLALVLQEEYIDEPSDGEFLHVKSPRIAEWPVEFLSRPRRNERTIPDFLPRMLLRIESTSFEARRMAPEPNVVTVPPNKALQLTIALPRGARAGACS